MLDTVIIGAIAAALGSVIGVIGKVIVDIKRVEKEPDQADMELKDELAREKDKNDAAIEQFTEVAKELKGAIESLKEDLGSRLDEMDKRIESYRGETREINKSELRHSITQIYFQHLPTKTLDLRTKDDLCSLYTAYSSIGGNSFAHELYEEMMDWDVK